MPKFRNMVLIFSTITSTGSLRRPSNHSQSRSSVRRVTPLMLHQRPFIELVKTPGRRRNPQAKGKSAVPSSSRLRSVLTASIEVGTLGVTLVETDVTLRNRKRKTIRPSHRTPSHKLSSMLETKRTLSRVRYRLARNLSSPRPPTYNYLQLSKSPIRRNKWSNRHPNPNHQPSHSTYHTLLSDRLVLNRSRSKMRSSSTSLRMALPFPHQSHL